MGEYSSNFIGNYLASCGLHNPTGEAMVYGDRRLTWSDLNDRTKRLAQALMSRGVRKGDKVLMMFHNCPEFLEANYAVQRCGAIPVPMNYRFTPSEIEYQANHSDAVAFVIEDIWLSAVQKAAPNLKNVKHYICAGPECPSDMEPYEKVIEESPPDEPDVPTDEEDICVICYTGGTTGFPKGVMLTYRAHLKMFEELIVSMATRIAEVQLTPTQKERIRESMSMPGGGLLLSLMGTSFTRWLMNRNLTNNLMHKFAARLLRNLNMLKKGYENNNRVIFPSFPLFHDASYQLTMLAPVVGNMTFVAAEGVKFDPEKVLAMVEKEQPSMMANVPTGWKMLVGHPGIDKFNTGSLVFCASGAGLCSADLKKKVLEKFPGVLFMDMFGQTEMTPVTSFRIDSTPETISERSVGRPMVETRVVDEQNNDVPQGQIGEIIYKSQTTMKGYYKDEKKTSEVMRDGWFYSGDLGYLDESGEIRIVERKNECISTGGEKVFPLEVEQVISEHPAVKNVCVIGVPDEKWGHSIRAVVQLKEGKEASSEEITSMCEDKLAGYKKPRSVAFVEEFPLSPVGKVLRKKIREMYGKP